MKPNEKYFRYLDKFKTTVTLNELRSQAKDLNTIALRHDIDHDIDIALDFAFYEHQLGFRSTYFILHDHPYNDDPHFLDKLLQIQDYGHEIGIHLNILAGWLTNLYDNPSRHLKNWLKKARDAGIIIQGCATHGAKECYEYNVINNWFFSQQLKTSDNYQGLTPEGISSPDNNNLIPYPTEKNLLRADGQTLPLWNADMEDFGLQYEAVDTKARYWSDTGKDWHRTGDPMNQDIDQGKHQVLMHPIHWLSEPRKIFFISTARAGSKWTAKSLAFNSSATVTHEWTLNHRQRNSIHVQEKITTLDNEGLLEKSNYSEKLIEYSKRYFKNDYRDTVEFNVYLVDHLNALTSTYPNAEIYGLTRAKNKVVPSLLNRGWYASKNSVRHPHNQQYENLQLNQLEKANKYWDDVNAIVKKASKSIHDIGTISASTNGFQHFLESIDFPTHARLIEKTDLTPVDQSHKTDTATKEESRLKNSPFHHIQKKFNSFLNAKKLKKSINGYLISSIAKPKRIEYSTSVTIDNVDSAWLLFDSEPTSKWGQLATNGGISLGHGSHQIDGKISFKVQGTALYRLFYLEYCPQSHKLINKRSITQLTPGWRGIFSEIVNPGSNLCCFGIHISRQTADPISKNLIHINNFEIEYKRPDDNYLFTRSSDNI